MRSARSLNGDPNVVPMIDILLVLLTIFILAIAELLAKKQTLIHAQLPDQSGGGVAEAPIEIAVLPGPVYEINHQRIPDGGLRQRVDEVLRGRPRKVIFVRGDRAATYQDVVTAFDVGRGAGAIVAVSPR